MLKVHDLAVSRGGRSILDGLELEVAAGEIRLLVGSSGAGKTTLLRAIAGFEPLSGGRILVGGEIVSAFGRTSVAPHLRGIGMAFQHGALWDHLSVEQHLQFGLDARSRGRGRSADSLRDVLALVGLEARRRDRPGRLSGGERQRLGLARALAREPRLLLLDEPLAHVDLRAQNRLAARLFAWLSDRGTTVLWVTHRPGEVALVGGTASLLDHGRIEKTLGTTEVAAWLAETGT